MLALVGHVFIGQNDELKGVGKGILGGLPGASLVHLALDFVR